MICIANFISPIRAPQWKCKVARVKVKAPPNNRKVLVELDLSEQGSVLMPGALVEPVTNDLFARTRVNQCRSLKSLKKQYDEDTSEVSSPRIQFYWSLHFCRQPPEPSGPAAPIHTVERQVLDDEIMDTFYEQEEYDADVDESNDGPPVPEFGRGNDSDSSVGENDTPPHQLPRRSRRRLLKFLRQRVKNDIVHLFFRFERVLSKEHGAYYDFIRDLRDALFILNQDDLDACLRVLREKSKMTPQEIEAKLAHDFDWFLRRVRRLVPTPPELEERYMRVYNAYKDIVCAKKGNALFESKDAKRAHKSFLKHIRRNCVSDVPLPNYYIPIRIDRHGLTIYLCIRGTSKNEGLHQKLRQLLRGFSNSPRLIVALLTEFFKRWNLNIAVKVRGLPELYDGLYDTELLEELITALSKSKQCEASHLSCVFYTSHCTDFSLFVVCTSSGMDQN